MRTYIFWPNIWAAARYISCSTWGSEYNLRRFGAPSSTPTSHEHCPSPVLIRLANTFQRLASASGSFCTEFGVKFSSGKLWVLGDYSLSYHSNCCGIFWMICTLDEFGSSVCGPATTLREGSPTSCRRYWVRPWVHGLEAQL